MYPVQILVRVQMFIFCSLSSISMSGRTSAKQRKYSFLCLFFSRTPSFWDSLLLRFAIFAFLCARSQENSHSTQPPMLVEERKKCYKVCFLPTSPSLRSAHHYDEQHAQHTRCRHEPNPPPLRFLLTHSCFLGFFFLLCHPMKQNPIFFFSLSLLLWIV